jgi:hypothetical protein
MSNNDSFDFNNPFSLNSAPLGGSPGAPPPPLEIRRNNERWPYIYRQYEFHQVDQVDQHGRTPLFYARSLEAIEYFIERGSNVFHRDADNKTFLHFLFSSDEDDMYTRDRLYGLFDTAVTSLRKHINKKQLWELIDSVDNEGNTILHYATMYKQLGKDEYGVLVSYIDLSIKNNEGLEAVDIARQDALTFEISLVYVILIVQENDRRSRREYKRHFAQVGKNAAEISKTIYGNLPDDVFKHVMSFLKGKRMKNKKIKKSKRTTRK